MITQNITTNDDETLNVAIILTNEKRQIIWANKAFTKITGFSQQELAGRKPGSLLQGKGTEPRIVRRIRENLNKGISFKDEITNYRKDGTEYPCRLVIHPIFDLNDTLTHFIAFEIDSTGIEDDSHIPLLQVDYGRKYIKSNLSNTKERTLWFQLVELIEVQSIYRQVDLTAKKLAQLLNTNMTYLSQVVNHYTSRSIKQFINDYRVRDARDKLTNPKYQNKTIEEIGLMCGFANRATFYRVFRETMDLTPAHYRKKHRTRDF